MVPSWDTIEDIAIGPLHFVEIEHPNLIVLLLRVPATVDKDLVGASLFSFGKDTAASSALWTLVDRFDLLPLLCLEIEGVDIVEVLSGETNTAVATKDYNFALENAGAHVGSGCWCSDIGLQVFKGWLSANTAPLHIFDVQDPGVIEPALLRVVTTEDKELVALRCGLSDVLRTGQWLISAAGLFFVPSTFVCKQLG